MNPAQRSELEGRIRNAFPHLDVEVDMRPVDYVVKVRLGLRNGSTRELSLKLVKGHPSPDVDEMAIYFAHEIRKQGVDY